MAEACAEAAGKGAVTGAPWLWSEAALGLLGGALNLAAEPVVLPSAVSTGLMLWSSVWCVLVSWTKPEVTWLWQWRPMLQPSTTPATLMLCPLKHHLKQAAL